MNNILIIKIYMSDDNAEWLGICGEYIKEVTAFRAKAATYGYDVQVAIIPTRSVYCCFAEVESDGVIGDIREDVAKLVKKLTEDYTTTDDGRVAKPSDVKIIFRQVTSY